MNIQFPQILFQIINFGVVVGGLSYLLFGPIMKILDERAKRIEEGQAAAEKALAEQANVDVLKKQAKQQADKDAAKILEEATKVAADKKSKLLAQAKAEALAEVERLRQSWTEEKRSSLQSMKSQFADAVIATAEKVLGESVSAKTHAKLIDDEFAALIKKM